MVIQEDKFQFVKQPQKWGCFLFDYEMSSYAYFGVYSRDRDELSIGEKRSRREVRAVVARTSFLHSKGCLTQYPVFGRTGGV